jgi:hypothetical protein
VIVNPTIETFCDAVTRTIALVRGSSAIVAGALITAARGTTDRIVRLFLPGSTETCSVYVPGQTLTTSPGRLKLTASSTLE